MSDNSHLPPFLSFAEEILLLTLDDEIGEIAANLSPFKLNIILAGSVLADLALEIRIDTDLERLFIVDTTPTNDEMLDPVLREIAEELRTHNTTYWIERISARGDEIREKAIGRLVERGVLVSEAGNVFLSHSVSRARRFTTRDGQVIEEVKLRIMRVLFDDEIPDPRDIIIICLADSCRVFERIFTRAEIEQVRERIELMWGMDVIARSIGEAVREIDDAHPSVVSTQVKNIPLVKGSLILGSAIPLIKDPAKFLLEQYRRHGPVFEIKAGNRKLMVITGPEAGGFAHRNNMHFRSLELWQGMNHLFGVSHMLNSMDGPQHIRMRRIHAGHYSRKLIENRLTETIQIARSEFDRWPQNTSMSVLRAFQLLVCQQLGVLSMGINAREYLDDLVFVFTRVLNVYVVRAWPKILVRSKRYQRAFERLMVLSQEILDAHEAGATPPDGELDFVDEVLQAFEAEPHLVPETDWRLLTLGPLLAGLDTAGGTSSFMLYHVLKNPDLREKITAEADAFFDQLDDGDEALSQKSLRSLQVVQNTLAETLRMHPLAPMLARRVSNSFEFEGYNIPAGADVLIGYAMSHYMEELYPDPYRFDIERYSPERAEHKKHGAYAPFGVGSHTCLGRSLAELVIPLNVITILHHLDVELDPPDLKLKTKTLPQLHPHKSLKFRINGWRNSTQR